LIFDVIHYLQGSHPQDTQWARRSPTGLWGFQLWLWASVSPTGCPSCRSKDFAFDVLMMPYDHDDLMPYENALLKFNSRQKFKNTRYNIKKISSVLGREFQIETAKGLPKKFKQKFLFQEIYSLVINYQRM